MKGALEGVKVLGFTHFAQGPFALQILGDMGANIVNIERPETGDFNRHVAPDEKLGGEGPFFLAMNRNKKGITLNLKAEKSKEIVKKLIEKADVVVSNYRAGALDKLGFGYEDARKINPDIIYCEALGYGSSGPYAKLPGQDLLAQALSGYCNICGVEGIPATGGIYVVDMYSSLMLVIGVMGALLNVKNGGHGQKVEINLLDSALHMQSQEFCYYMNTGIMPKKSKDYTGHPLQEAPYGLYRTKNGYIALAINAGQNMKRFCEIIGLPDLYAQMPSKEVMLRDKEKLHDQIAPQLNLQNTEYWVEKFQTEDFWVAKVNTYEDVLKDPQVEHNKIIRTIPHPKAGEFRAIMTPIQFSETPVQVYKAPPLLGQDNREVLGELGYSAEEIEAILQSGIMG
jgi:crotonobetainyl-CoA:carnitine CoA-transferase CaiB-like acyl-CoA transferase